MSEDVLSPGERQTLGALRYAVNDEAVTYLAIMRLFTTGMSGFLSDQSAEEITARLADLGHDADRETVEQRLSYLVEHGNLARSPRETEARSVREYLTNRSRYQLTSRGELVHRQVEELLAHTDGAREVSSEMLPGILTGLEELVGLVDAGTEHADPRDVASRIATLFAQFEVLVTSTREFYAYLTQVLTRFDLVRDEFVMFKTALIDYLQRFVDEVARHMPQVSDRLLALEPDIPTLCGRANADTRLMGIDGTAARRATGLDPEDWRSLHTWFIGSPGRRSDADNVRALATDAMRSLLTNLRRLAAGADRQQSRYGDLLRLARWFESADDALAHDLWAATFGLYPARHLSFTADPEGDPMPATRSWWRASAAEVPVTLRTHGERRASGRASARVDYTAAKRARLAEREQERHRRLAAARELATISGPVRDARLGDDARRAFLDLYTSALARHGRPLGGDTTAHNTLRIDDLTLAIEVRHAPGSSVRLRSPGGTLTLQDLYIHLEATTESAGPEETAVTTEPQTTTRAATS
ncbi:TIGR02677 family protein [Janibacter cremeus]|uniref:TIGR02677 family protein n=1 Tax=Janibacter cremeus TaxID=1285192 RepID=UPI0023F73FFE|nr:TIGR02677 family protein [Janibacter cremeus]WEV78756.1 TIGR02677 family protein [Janibacter cremeus]